MDGCMHPPIRFVHVCVRTCSPFRARVCARRQHAHARAHMHARAHVRACMHTSKTSIHLHVDRRFRSASCLAFCSADWVSRRRAADCFFANLDTLLSIVIVPRTRACSASLEKLSPSMRPKRISCTIHTNKHIGNKNKRAATNA